MNREIAKEIQSEQNHGRQKYGKGPRDTEHDDQTNPIVWHQCINDHNRRAQFTTPMERRQHLIKIAGLAISAVEAFDRNQKARNSEPHTI